MRKRPTIKGKGADVFLAPKEQAPGSPPRRREHEERIMATFYLSPTLIDKLDRAWLKRREKDRKAQKSHIVAEALLK